MLDFNNSPFQLNPGKFAGGSGGSSGNGGVAFGIVVGLLFWGFFLVVLAMWVGVAIAIALGVVALFFVGKFFLRVWEWGLEVAPWPTLALTIAAFVFGSVLLWNRAIAPAFHSNPTDAWNTVHALLWAVLFGVVWLGLLWFMIDCRNQRIPVIGQAVFIIGTAAVIVVYALVAHPNSSALTHPAHPTHHVQSVRANR